MNPHRLSHLDAPKILVVRNDGLGDFILTLPLVAALKKQIPNARLFALVHAGLAGLIPLLPDLEGAILDEGVLLRRHRGVFPPARRREKRMALLQEVRAHRFDAALLPYSEAPSAALVHRAGIPLRVGSLRRPHFWRFNLHNPTSRKGSDRAEYELNLTYLERLGLREEYAAPALHLAGGKAEGSTPTAPSAPYVVMHPYKRSSTALSWPLANFLRLAEGFAAVGLAVVVVGDALDAPVLQKAFPDPAGGRLRLETGLALPELMRLIAGARLFVGGSSGPLHLAGLAGTPHIGFFPQNRVSAPARWRTLPVVEAPVETPADPAAYLLSPSFPKHCVRCELERCPHFNCVAAISLEEAWQAARAWGVEPPRAERDALRATGS